MEISIVLVILGLLTGGVLAGQSLIKAAELRSQITQIEEYELAVNVFKDKYLGTPGDLINAESFWPAQTNNGDGDGMIEAATGFSGTYTSADNQHFDGERPHFFRQLSLASLVKDAFDGSQILGSGYPKTAINPSAGIFIAGPWQLHLWSPVSGNTLYDNISDIATSRMYLYLGVCNPAMVGAVGGSVSGHNDLCGTLTSEEMYQIETKIDDAIPKSGKILAQSWNAFPVCSINAGQDYNLLESSARTCNMLYKLSD
mgnify:CR=1 FL=1